ncbi:MAG TPA: malto-oligosyltrehalose trehalohydrolase [Xanthobacteraceae bacterium]|nr:malto-oligosyltrehalose trehalohydrolase [Xanthobacteraceae bacterium]
MIESLGAAGKPRRHGPATTEHGVVFNLWAPTAQSVDLVEQGQSPQPMPRDGDGWYQLLSPTARAGSRYQFRINGDLVVPDPASRFQPDDVGQPSEVLDTSSLRDNVVYPGRAWSEVVIYELHVGAFSEEGTYTGVEERLDYLRELGITAIELMPLNDVPGRHNWGYDGVLLNAPNARYGRPEDLKRMLRAAHDRNIMVYLDVVYNHFGPQFNYLHSYAEPFFTNKHTTGWGPAVNLEGHDGQFVRRFLIDNALMWLRDYGFDGLRFDAVHALKDDSDRHFLQELAETVRAELHGRHVHLILENESNQAHLLERTKGRIMLYDAQWADDFHNALHVMLTGEKEGYYGAFADKPLEHLARSLTEGFAFQGEVFPLHNQPRGEPSAHLPPEATIFFAQNHDQVGNRALGERLSMLLSADKLKQVMALLILNPHIPMLFMGEEAAAETPFLFFADWQGEIAQLTRDGRRKEFAGFSAFSTPELRDRIPDPTDESTFTASKLNWQVINHAPRSAEFRALTRELLALRQREIVPLIEEGFASAKAELLGRGHSKEALNVVWRTDRNTSLQIITSFSERTEPIPTIEGSVLWNSERGASASLRPHQIVVAVDRRS